MVVSKKETRVMMLMASDRMTLEITTAVTLDQKEKISMDRRATIRRGTSTRRAWTSSTFPSTRSGRSLTEGRECSRVNMVRATQTWRERASTRKRLSPPSCHWPSCYTLLYGGGVRGGLVHLLAIGQ